MKYKIGDRVKIIDHPTISELRRKVIELNTNRVFTIKEAGSLRINSYLLKEIDWEWSEIWLEKVSEEIVEVPIINRFEILDI
jgi:hypothetical protein